MLKLLITAFVLTLAVTLNAADAKNLGTLDKADAEFVQKAALASMTEIHCSELALKRALTVEEKVFAQQMIDDHTKANKELAVIAEKKGVSLPSELDSKCLEKVEKLEKKDEKDFGEAYVKFQVAAHKDAVSLFDDAGKDAKDADVRAFAITTLPTLKAHLDHAKLLEKKY